MEAKVSSVDIRMEISGVTVDKYAADGPYHNHPDAKQQIEIVLAEVNIVQDHDGTMETEVTLRGHVLKKDGQRNNSRSYLTMAIGHWDLEAEIKKTALTQIEGYIS